MRVGGVTVVGQPNLMTSQEFDSFCVNGVFFLASVIATQPFWAAGAQPTYDQWVEVAALLVIAAMPTGGWSGLDYYVRQWCPMGSCCGASGCAPASTANVRSR